MSTQDPLPPYGASGEPGATTTAPPGSPAPDGLPAAEFFDRIRGLGVVRPDEGRWAAGVCAGLARRWQLDPLLVRGLFVVLGIVTGIGLGAYGLLWLFLPHADGRIHAQQLLRGVVTSGFVGAALFVIIDFPLSGSVWHSDWGFHPLGGLPLLIIGGLGVWWWLARGQHGKGGMGAHGPSWLHVGMPGSTGSAPTGTAPFERTTSEQATSEGAPSDGPTAPVYGTPEPPRPSSWAAPVATAPAPLVAPAAPRTDLSRPLHSLTLSALGAALLGAVGVLGWDRYVRELPAPAGLVAVVVALGVVAVGVVLAGVLGRRSGGLAPIAVVLAIAAANGAVWQDSLHGVGTDIRWAPASAPAGEGYSLGAGQAVLDLTNPSLVHGATAVSPARIPASVGAGELVVVVPKGTTTRVDSTVGLGNVSNELDPGDHSGRNGAGVKETVTQGTGDPVLVVEAHVGFGQVRIVPPGTPVP